MLYFFFEESDMCIEKVMCFFNLLHSRRNWWNDKYLRCLYWSGNFDGGQFLGKLRQIWAISCNLCNCWRRNNSKSSEMAHYPQSHRISQIIRYWNYLFDCSNYITNNQILEIISSIIAQIISQTIRYWKLSLRILLKLYKSANSRS